MATMTFSLPDDLLKYAEAVVKFGDYADIGEYITDLVNRDRREQGAATTADGQGTTPPSP